MGWTNTELFADDEWRARIHSYADQYLAESGSDWADLPHDLAEAVIAQLLSDWDLHRTMSTSVRQLAQAVGLMDKDGEFR